MKELSLNILDIAENSLKAGATQVEILLTEKGNTLTIEINDNGCGMSEKTLAHIRKLHKAGVNLIACESAEGLEDLFGVKDTGKMIGIILHFEDTEESCEIGYAIGSKYWNKGYVTEAAERFMKYCFDEMGVQKVYASFFSGNEGSKRVMEKCGMTYDHFAEKELTYLDKERDLSYYVKRR